MDSRWGARKMGLHTWIQIVTIIYLTHKETLAQGVLSYGAGAYTRDVGRRGSDRTHQPMAEWGQWGAWTTCSRTCGIGVSSRSRQCAMPEGAKDTQMKSNCIGEYRQFQTCNIQPCPSGSKEFRAVQCESFNNKAVNGRIYKWDPYYRDKNRCVLACRAHVYRFYAKLAEKVVDGTLCDPDDPTHICVAGRCQRVGCDGVLGSDKALDKCGVCGGDATSCHIISGIFTRQNLPYGYNKVTTLPVGACNINITEMAPSSNYLALKLTHGGYFLNGNWALGYTNDYQGAGAIFHYKRALPGQSRDPRESITTRGPTNDSVDLMILKQQDNRGILYSYTIPMDKYSYHPGTNKRTRDMAALYETAGGSTDTDRYISKDEFAASVARAQYPDRLTGRGTQLAESRGAGEADARAGAGTREQPQKDDTPLSARERYLAHRERVRLQRERARLRDRQDAARQYRREDPNAISPPVSAFSSSSSSSSSSAAAGGAPQASAQHGAYRKQAPSPSQQQPQPGVNYGVQNPSASQRGGVYGTQSQSQNRPVSGLNYRPPPRQVQPQPGPNFGVQAQSGPSFGVQPQPGPNFGVQPQPRPNFGVQPQPGPNFGVQPQPGPNFGVQTPGRGSQPQPGINYGVGGSSAPRPGRYPNQPQPGINYGVPNSQVAPQSGYYPGQNYQQPPRQAYPPQVAPPVQPFGGQGVVSPGGQPPRYIAPKPYPQGSQAFQLGGAAAQGQYDAYGRYQAPSPGRGHVNDQISLSLPDSQRPRLGTLNPNADYSWKITGFTECTKSCGEGSQTTVVVCVKVSSQTIVTDENCDNDIKPELQTLKCNAFTCPPAWDVSEWSPCSTSCDEGRQGRSVACKQRVSETISLSVSPARCGTPRPEAARACNADTPCIRWKLGEWTKCSAECGRGERSRDVACVNAEDKLIAENVCKGSKPRATEICDMGSCAKTWFYSEWSDECSSACGHGVYTRQVYCSADPVRCAAIGQPDDEKPCRSDLPCGGSWFAGPWSKCTAACGVGVKKRDVTCIKRLGKLMAIVGEENCLDSERPETEQACERPVCRPEWYMTDWSECSKSCNTGFKTREVKCLNERREPTNTCDTDARPEHRATCNIDACATSVADPGCKDKFSNCRLVVQARLCRYDHYKAICCNSCTKHQHHHHHRADAT